VGHPYFEVERVFGPGGGTYMVRPFFKWFGLWITLPAVFIFSACGTGVSKKVIRPVQVPQGVPVAGVTDLAARSLGSLNYRVVEMDPAVGRIGAERSVPGDMYNRVTRMKIDVTPGNAGETLLNIEASTCPGCVPEATFDPLFMINEFNMAFDAQARGAGFAGQPAAGQLAQSRQVTVDEQKAMEAALANDQRKVYLGIEMQNVTPELAAYLGMAEARGVLIQNVQPGSPAEKAGLRRGDVILEGDLAAVRDSYDVVMLVSKKTEGERLSLLIWQDGKTFTKTTRLAARPGGPPQGELPVIAGTAERGAARTAETAEPSATLPFVQITRVAVNPPSVPPGGKFDVVVDYSVKDSTTQQQQISAQLTIEILDGEQLIYSHELIEMISTNGGSTRRTEPLAGSKTAGAYTLRASVKYGDTSATGQTRFNIQ